MQRGSTALVTGGAGFIGSHLVERLLGDGHSVRVLDDLSTGKLANLAFTKALPAGRFELIQADIADEAARRRAVLGVDTVFHQAALPSVPRSVAEPMAAHQANATATLGLLVDAREAGVRRVVYASSSAVYGDTPVLPKREEMPPEPRSPYAVSKLAGELYCRLFGELYGMGCVALRYFNVFGPRQDPGSEYAAVVPRFLSALIGGTAPVIYGDGEQTRDFTFVADVVEANLKAATAGDEAAGQVFNVAGGKSVALLELLRAMEPLVGRSVQPEFEPARAGDVRHSRADVARAREVLGWVARVELPDGLRRTLAGVQAESSRAP